MTIPSCTESLSLTTVHSLEVPRLLLRPSLCLLCTRRIQCCLTLRRYEQASLNPLPLLWVEDGMGLSDHSRLGAQFKSVQFSYSVVSNSLQPCGLWPARLLCLGDFPGKNTEMSCHTLLSSAQSLSCVRLFATPWIAACQASLSIIDFWSLPKPMSIELVMPSNHLILCCPHLLLPSIPPSIRVFSNESTLRMRWPKY